VKQIFLFDIDGTLIDSSGAGGAALQMALREEFGITDPKPISLAGRTDRSIALEFFTHHQIEPTEANWRRFRSAYLSRLGDLLPQRPGRILPGVRTLLQRLQQCASVAIGLLTGNVEEGARRKLTHFGLHHHFEFGGFGDDHACRDEVARAALRSAAQRHGEPEPERVWVIGDTPLDIRCARAIGARVVAVATGSFRLGELQSHQPDFALETLEDPTPWREILPDEGV
jgi:phosphoglycolate phosphatase